MEKLTDDIILSSKKLNAFFLRWDTRKAVHSFYFYLTLYCKSYTEQLRKKIKGIQIGKGEVKVSLFTEDMILYIEIPKEFTKIIRNRDIRSIYKNQL